MNLRRDMNIKIKILKKVSMKKLSIDQNTHSIFGASKLSADIYDIHEFSSRCTNNVLFVLLRKFIRFIYVQQHFKKMSRKVKNHVKVHTSSFFAEVHVSKSAA